jgi:hypothetical protein
MGQAVIKVDSAGNASLFSAIWPFGGGVPLKRVDRNVYEGPTVGRMALIDDPGSGSYIAIPALRLQRVPWPLDARWIAPALFVSTAVAVLTLLAWPFAALWRRWRRVRWSKDSGNRDKFLAVRLVMLIDAVVIVATVVLFFISVLDWSVFNDALDPPLLLLYALAWLGVLGAIPAVWAAALFWRNGAGSRWSRIHHTLMAVSSVMMAWFFVTFRIAGTTLSY